MSTIGFRDVFNVWEFADYFEKAKNLWNRGARVLTFSTAGNEFPLLIRGFEVFRKWDSKLLKLRLLQHCWRMGERHIVQASIAYMLMQFLNAWQGQHADTEARSRFNRSR